MHRFLLIPILFFFLNEVLSYCQPQNLKDIEYSIPHAKINFYEFPPRKIEFDNEQTYKLYADQYGISTVQTNLSGMFSASWTKEGILITGKVRDDIFYVDPDNPWKSDAMEIFLSPYRGSNDIIQLTILPCKSDIPAKANVVTGDYRGSSRLRGIPAFSEAYSQRISDLTYYQILLPFNSLGIEPAVNTSFAMQVYFNDTDKKGSLENQLQWYPIGHSYENSFAMYDLILTSMASSFSCGTSKCYITDDEKINLIIYGEPSKNTHIRVISNGEIIFNADTVASFPKVINFSARKINPEKDTLRVFVDDKLISVHDLFIVPRRYINSRTPGKFEREIRFFEACDRKFPPLTDGVLFIGSSSIKRWYSLKDDFSGKNIIHRGFGGSTAADALFYFNRIVLPYKPSAIFYYEGDNDIPGGISKEKIVSQIDSFLTIAHHHFPEAEIYIISPKPSYARYKLLNKYTELNNSLKKLCSQYKFASFVDVATPMFGENGILRKDIFENDSLHLNEEGYRIWKQVIGRTFDQSAN